MAKDANSTREPPAAPRTRLDWPAIVNRARLISGLTMLCFVASHLLNHAIGIHSLQAMIAAQDWFIAFWQMKSVTFLFALAASVHLGLAMWSIYRRRNLWAMKRWEAAQLIFGLLIPPLLVEHLVMTRVTLELHHAYVDYTYVIHQLFADPVKPWLQAALLIIAWTHGIIGMNFWLRYKPWFPVYKPYLAAATLLIPVLALVGYWSAAREIMHLSRDPAWPPAALKQMNQPSPEAMAHLYALRNVLWLSFVTLLLSVLGARLLRAAWDARRRRITVTYPGGRKLRLTPGPTVLEMSLSNGVPHASVCGGRGRCSTCRVKLGKGLEELEPAADGEAKVLARVGASERVRLACQIRPTADIDVMPLLPASIAPAQSTKFPDYHHGRDMPVVVMFADLRGFTTLSENRLPYDVVFILNRYFRAMGEAIESSGGHLDKFIGDGIMALFGLDDGPEAGARNALRAAKRMIERLEDLNRDLVEDLVEPLRIGIGLHEGGAIVGDLGYGTATSLTAIGDVVNTASRLESASKDFKTALVVSEAVMRLAGLAPDLLESHNYTPRGRMEAMTIGVLRDPANLPS